MKPLKDIGRDMRMTSAIPGFARDELRDEIKQEAIKILKQNKEINTADWVEFFGIEKDFADECLTKIDAVEKNDERGAE